MVDQKSCQIHSIRKMALNTLPDWHPNMNAAGRGGDRKKPRALRHCPLMYTFNQVPNLSIPLQPSPLMAHQPATSGKRQTMHRNHFPPRYLIVMIFQICRISIIPHAPRGDLFNTLYTRPRAYIMSVLLLLTTLV